jgi:hypothetical protein
MMSAIPREVFNKDHRLARIAFFHARVGDRVLALQALPGDAANAGHGVAHLVKHLADMAVVPGQAQAFADLLDDPEILSCVTRGLDGLATHLHQAIGVGEGAGFLRKSAGRQDHIGQVRGLGQEDVLHHHVLQAGHGLAGMVGVGVTHRRVLALHVHALDAAFLGGMHHLHHRQAYLVIQ